MLCSIIIPLYNKEAFIDAAIQSILNQQHQNFEVIVVDDGSSDDGPSRVRDIKDQRIHLVQQANAGVSSARNRGIDLAEGELVCFLDADDWYHPMYLKSVVSMATRYPEISFFATKYLIFKKTDDPIMTWDLENNTNIQLIDDLYYYWRRFGAIFCTCSVTVRRKFLTSFQPCFPLGESLGEDQDLWFRLAEKSTLAYCPSPLVAWRYVQGSLCDAYTAYTMLPVYSRIEQRVLHGLMPDKLRPSALRLITEVNVNIARNALINGQRFKAFIALRDVRRGIRSRRWWVTAIMCCTFLPSTVKRWEKWRYPLKRN